MSAAEMHEAVLAALDRLAEVEAATSGSGTNGAWSECDTGAEVAIISDGEWLVAERLSQKDAALIVAARNAFPDAVALARLVVETHAPLPPQVTSWGDVHVEDAACLDEWPCREYRAAAAFAGIDLDEGVQ